MRWQVPEHTWGVDIKTYLPDTSNWANWQFQEELATNAKDYTYVQVGACACTCHSQPLWASEPVSACFYKGSKRGLEPGMGGEPDK